MAVREEVKRLVVKLPEEGLQAARLCLQGMHGVKPVQAAIQGEDEDIVAVEYGPFAHPTVFIRPSVLLHLRDTMPDVGGDALEDSEALYDEA